MTDKPTSADLDEMASRFNVFDPEIQKHAPELWAHLRKTCPISRSEASGGFWSLTRYSDVNNALRHPEQLSSFPSTIPAAGNAVPMIPIEIDPPNHLRYRTLLSARFSTGAVEALEPRIRELIGNILDDLAGATEVDLVQAVANPVPLQVILDLLMDIPREDQAFLREAFMAILHPQGASEEANRELAATLGQQVAGYFAGLIASRRGSQAEDLISVLLRSEVEGERLSEDEIVGFCLTLVPAGFDTTSSTIAYAFHLFHKDPTILEALRADRGLLPRAVEELLRLSSPVPLTGRTATGECTLAGQDVAAGERVALVFHSANRDEQVFEDAEQFRVDRSPNRHLAFGAGIHRCIGNHVARAEIRVLLEEWLDRDMPTYQLAAEPVMGQGLGWGLLSLPVRFDRVPALTGKSG